MAALMLLGPVLAFLVVVGTELLIDVALRVGAPTVGTGVAGVIGRLGSAAQVRVAGWGTSVGLDERSLRAGPAAPPR
jgi:hypothetical protein